MTDSTHFVPYGQNPCTPSPILHYFSYIPNTPSELSSIVSPLVLIPLLFPNPILLSTYISSSKRPLHPTHPTRTHPTPTPTPNPLPPLARRLALISNEN